ncbi:MAG: alkaline phosphatase D family protein [Rhodospirillales bacterium]|nr:alkaline phosphatase D family protein [Rhodospirillales bacterium]
MPAGTTRRALLLATGAALAGCAAPAPISSRTSGTDPFTLGVASGDPWPDGFVLWTRLVPDRLAPNGGMPAAADVVWEIARDPYFATVERSGTVRTQAASAHSVHVEIGGLAPARDYWYRFRANGHASPTGRARTAPAPGTLPARLAFVTCGCNHFEHGLFTAYRHIAREAPDFAFHYGDYIYEYGTYRGPLPRARLHEGAMCRTLDDYRRRYAQYKSDPDLQAAHAATPFVVSYDDHEVANNWSREYAQSSGDDPAVFLARRNAALQAWYEHLPLRAAQRPTAAGTTMYRALAFGDLAAFDVLDTRQYRTRQPCGDAMQPACPAMDAPQAQMLGPAQESWLFDRLANSRARWNFLGQQVAMMRIDGGDRIFNMDSWAGYTAARGRLHAFLAQRRPSNPVVLTGDWHRNWIGELKADYDDPRSATLAPEFLATSISSDGDPAPDGPRRARVLAANPHLRHYSDRRGYMAFELTASRLDVRLRSVASVVRPDAPVETTARFSVVAGDPRVHAA